MIDRKILVIVILYGLILGGLASLNGGILVLAIPFVIYLAIALWDAPEEPDLQVDRVIEPERALPWTPVTIKLSILNKGKPIDFIRLEDIKPDGLEIIEGDERLISNLAHGEAVEIQYTVNGKRGIYRFDFLNVTVSGRMGLFERRKKILTNGQVFVLPEVPQLKRVAFRTLQTRVYAGNIPSRVAGLGTDFFGVRSYHPGDPLRYINWRVSARFPEFLFSNEFERQRVSDIWLVLDGRQRSNFRKEKGELFEHIVLAGAGLAQVLLNEGNRVGLLVYGGYLQWTYPGYGKIQRERMLRSLAQARPGNLFIFSGLENLPTRVLPISSQIILISPLHPEDIPVIIHLRARGYPILVISPDPILFEANLLEKEEGGQTGMRLARVERQLLLRKLLNAGVNVINWDVSMPFEQAVRARLRHLMWKFHPLRPIR